MTSYRGPKRPPLIAMKGALQRLDRERGLLVAFEGPDAAEVKDHGKLIASWLRRRGQSVDIVESPSASELGLSLQARKTTRCLNPYEYALLQASELRHRVESEVLPALCGGRGVVAIQYILTAMVESIERGIEAEWLVSVHGPILWPDVIFTWHGPSAYLAECPKTIQVVAIDPAAALADQQLLMRRTLGDISPRSWSKPNDKAVAEWLVSRQESDAA